MIFGGLVMTKKGCVSHSLELWPFNKSVGFEVCRGCKEFIISFYLGGIEYKYYLDIKKQVTVKTNEE